MTNDSENSTKSCTPVKDPIINCHTHIFTGDHVPPFLAKSYLPVPFYWLLHLRPIVLFFRWWYKGPATTRYTVGHKRVVKTRTAITAFFTRLYPFNVIAGYYIFLIAFFTLYGLINPVFPPEKSWLSNWVSKAYAFLAPVLPDFKFTWLKVVIVLVVLLFFANIRNLVIFVADRLWKFLVMLPGKQTRELFRRYLNIGRYAFHKKQNTILSKLKAQYPRGTKFIILPMDMDYMGAGNSNKRYRDQMAKLAEIKETDTNKDLIYPFVFADPRRMVDVKKEKRYKPGDKEYFNWQIVSGEIKPGDCFIRDYLVDHRFSGIKIYPALGYYPFDVKLLPLWKYAADNNIPVLTHCIKGVIFYRGIKKHSWNAHPVFKQSMQHVKNEKEADGFRTVEEMEKKDAETIYEPLVLPQVNNIDFSYNFTHPLNYLCILEEELLRGIVGAEIAKDPDTPLKALFGYKGPGEAMSYDLRNLKICLGHFGGEDEWKRYFERDRYNYSSQLTRNPHKGIEFFKKTNGDPSPGKPEQLWKYTDWYSIICSMMLKYPNVYADISYILHGDKDILPLLKQTLQNPGLKEKVLYGTDFFVVRNHKSDKNMLADMMGGLCEEDFDLIARKNPVEYLKSALQTAG